MEKSKKRIQEKAPHQEAMLRFLAGCRAMRRSKAKIIAVLFYSLTMALIWVFREHILRQIPLPDINGMLVSGLSILYRLSLLLLMPVLAVMILIIIIIQFGSPKDARRIRDKLWEMAIHSSAGRSPLLTGIYPSEENPNIIIYEFEPFGIPESKWDLRAIGGVIKRNVKSLEERNGRYLLRTTRQGSDFNINVNDDEY